jgi:hypothetical protein
MPNKIRFSEMWEKLKVREPGQRFGTYRGYEPGKDYWYLSCRNEKFEVEIGGKFYGWANLCSVDYYWAAEIDEVEIKADTYLHWTKDDFQGFLKKMYRNTNPFLIHLVFEWVEVVK